MTLRVKGSHTKAETAEDLANWLGKLSGCPEVNRVQLANCRRPEHGGDAASWFYVEADAAAGVARLRCLSCGYAHAILDSERHWSFPPTWSCHTCGQSIAEVGFGLHVSSGEVVSWLAVGVRCVNCGDLGGVCDFVLRDSAVDEVLAAL